MKDEPKPTTINRYTYLKALGMFTIANQLYVQARDIQLRMDAMLGLEDGSHLDDEIYSNDLASVRDFDAALKRSDFVVEPDAIPVPQ